MNPVDYLLIGNMTADLLADGSYIAGGTVSYAAPVAQAFGLRVGIVTRTRPEEPLLDTLRPYAALHVVDSAETTIFENIYTPQGRIQYVRGVADDITPAEIPQAWQGALMVHLAPIAREAAHVGILDLFPQATILFTPQGWLRQWDAQGLISPVAWRHSWAPLRGADAVILSPEDLGGDADALAEWRAHARLLVLTLGRRGAIVYDGDHERRVPAYDVVEVDPTGAGDVFAAAFLVRLDECGDPVEAARFANCAASFVVEGLGASRLPTRAQVAWRMTHGRSLD